MASDRRAYFLMADSILHEGWDDTTIADLARLSAYLNTKWARERRSAEDAGTAWLSPQDCMLVTGTASPARARRRLSALPARARVSLSAREEMRGRALGVYLEWPKFVDFQQYKNRGMPERRGNLGGISGESRFPASASASATRMIDSTRAGADFGIAPKFQPPGFVEARAWFDRVNEHEKASGLDPTSFGHAICLECAPWFIPPTCPGPQWEARAKAFVETRRNGWDLLRILAGRRARIHVEGMDQGPWKARENTSGDFGGTDYDPIAVIEAHERKAGRMT